MIQLAPYSFCSLKIQVLLPCDIIAVIATPTSYYSCLQCIRQALHFASFFMGNVTSHNMTSADKLQLVQTTSELSIHCSD